MDPRPRDAPKPPERSEILGYHAAPERPPLPASRVRSAILSLVICTAIPGLLIMPVIWTGAAGHGSMCLALLVFPWAMLTESAIGGLIQYATYASVLGAAALWGRWWLVFRLLLVAHVAGVAIAILKAGAFS
jgi:hypothetical protein